jgi:predicted nucleic acid binding AN1-type Zn finger protein
MDYIESQSKQASDNTKDTKDKEKSDNIDKNGMYENHGDYENNKENERGMSSSPPDGSSHSFRPLRCGKCKKKIILAVECRHCFQPFCVSDRLPEVHACPAMHMFRHNDITMTKVVPTKQVDKI